MAKNLQDYDLIKKREKDSVNITKGHGSLARNSYEYEILITLVDILAVLNNIDKNVANTANDINANLQGEK